MVVLVNGDSSDARTARISTGCIRLLLLSREMVKKLESEGTVPLQSRNPTELISSLAFGGRFFNLKYPFSSDTTTWPSLALMVAFTTGDATFFSITRPLTVLWAWATNKAIEYRPTKNNFFICFCFNAHLTGQKFYKNRKGEEVRLWPSLRRHYPDQVLRV
jgi:hypothetical protein